MWETQTMSLPCEVAVFISNYTVIDPEVFKLWVDGYPSTEAVNILHKKESKLGKWRDWGGQLILLCAGDIPKYGEILEVGCIHKLWVDFSKQEVVCGFCLNIEGIFRTIDVIVNFGKAILLRGDNLKLQI